MKKKLLFAVIALILTAGAFAQTEADFRVNLNQAGDGVIITGYTGSATQVRIPATFEGLPVTDIGGGNEYNEGAFRGNRTITAVIIPEGVIRIGDYAFNACGKLASVTIPASVTYIGRSAFGRDGNGQNGPPLTLVTIPNGTIGDWAFAGLQTLRSVTFGEGVTAIGAGAFYGTGITSIRIPASVKTIKGGNFGAFEGCGSLATVEFSEGLLEIGHAAFRNCTSLREITLPSTLVLINGDGNDGGAFYGCTSLTTVIVPENTSLQTWNGWHSRSVGISPRAFEGAPLNLATQIKLRNFGYGLNVNSDK